MFNHFGLFCNLFFAGKPFSPKHHGSWVRLCCGYACDTNAQNMFHFVQGEMCLFSWLFWNVTDNHSSMRQSHDNKNSNSHGCSCFMLMHCLVEGGSLHMDWFSTLMFLQFCSCCSRFTDLFCYQSLNETTAINAHQATSLMCIIIQFCLHCCMNLQCLIQKVACRS